MRREAVKDAGGLNEKLNMAMDYDLWLKLSFRHDLMYLPGGPMAGARSHSSMKTRMNQLEAYLEDLQVFHDNLRHPQCPRGIRRFRNRLYVTANLGAARNYLERNMPARAFPHIAMAVISDPLFVMKKPFKYLKNMSGQWS